MVYVEWLWLRRKCNVFINERLRVQMEREFGKERFRWSTQCRYTLT
jgi:hypothetical protein